MVGISTDDAQTQCDFAASNRLQFTTIADVTGQITRLYDVVWPLLRRTKRVTYLIDREGLIRGVFFHEFEVSKHVDDVLVALRRLKKAES